VYQKVVVEEVPEVIENLQVLLQVVIQEVHWVLVYQE
jgi:hypothetical protein